MSIRKAPNVPAKEFPTGTRKKGLDGKLWKVIKNEKGQKRWQKVVASTKKRKLNIIDHKKTIRTGRSATDQDKLIKMIHGLYDKKTHRPVRTGRTLRLEQPSPSPVKQLTVRRSDLKEQVFHIYDRGTYPWKVVKRGSLLTIYKLSDVSTPEFKYDRIVARYKNVRMPSIFKGRDQYKKTKGINSLLIKIGEDRYLFIGPMIYEFTTGGDKITKFHSSLGNNGITYPVAESKKNMYFLLDKVFVPRSRIPPTVVPHTAYKEFYGFDINIPLSRYAMKIKRTKKISDLHPYNFTNYYKN